MPEVSIIVPVYNTVNFLEACLNSIINQTFHDFELIIVEDGSTDGSSQICENYQKYDNRIKIYHVAHGGQSAARNLGIKKSEGKYIFFIDSDDYVVSDYLEKLYRIIVKENVDLVSCEMGGIVNERELKKEINLSFFSKNQEIMAAYLQESPFSFGPVTKAYRKELLKGIYFSEHKIYEDYFFNYQYFSRINTAIAIDFIGYFYVQNQNSTIRKPFDLQQFDNISEQHKVINEVMKYYPKYLPIASRNLAWGYYWIITKCLYLIREDRTKSRNYLNLIRNCLITDKSILKKSLPLTLRREKYLIKMIEYCPKVVWWAYNIKFLIKRESNCEKR